MYLWLFQTLSNFFSAQQINAPPKSIIETLEKGVENVFKVKYKIIKASYWSDTFRLKTVPVKMGMKNI